MTINKLIIFTHIPKAAGTSTSGLIRTALGEDMVWRPTNTIDLHTNTRDFQYLIGHFGVGVERYLNPLSQARKREQYKFTILRNPVDQLISLATYRINIKSSTSRTILGREIIDFYGNKKNKWMLNLQTKMLAGYLSLYLSTKLDISNDVRVYQFYKKLAIANIKNYFDRLFFFEDLASVTSRISEDIGIIKSLPHSEITMNKFRISTEDLTIEELNALSALCRYDIDIYKYAQTVWRNGKKI